MKIKLIKDDDVTEVIRDRTHGEPTYYLRNLLYDKYPGITTSCLLRKLKDMEKRGIVKRVKSPYFLNNISWSK